MGTIGELCSAFCSGTTGGKSLAFNAEGLICFLDMTKIMGYGPSSRRSLASRPPLHPHEGPWGGCTHYSPRCGRKMDPAGQAGLPGTI